ncbi:class I SAM-dependent methyltransferase [Candidatus Woesearchaeota archaeon]|nr:class I SAM-dependent methyltransferase [Candidatus Woesearchaeota archaeon]
MKSQEVDFRSMSLRRLILKYLPHGNILDVGCGPGFMSRDILRAGNEVTSIDIDKNLLGLAKKVMKRYKKSIKHLGVGELKALGEGRYDGIVCLDVIEHVKDDKNAIRNMHHVLKKDGKAIILVPAFQWLYGKRDVDMEHFRRYGKGDFVRKLKKGGFIIEEIRYWNMLGLIVYAFFEKVLQKKINEAVRYREKKGFSKLVNDFLSLLLGIEYWISLPLGLSLIAVVRKK